MSNRKQLQILFCALVLLGCSDRSPVATEAEPPRYDLSDGAHSSGNPHFFLLPPMVPQPSFTGVFDGSHVATVEICALTASGCTAPLIASFDVTSTDGAPYSVNWHTDQFAINRDKPHRITIRVAGTELGYADVVLVSNGSAKNATTGDVITLVDGRTLPIRFRIEEGAIPAEPTCLAPATGLIAWWPGDGNADDVIGGQNGTLMGGASFATGVVGAAFGFDGTDDYVALPGSWGGSAEVTVNAWVLTKGRTGDFQAIVETPDESFVHLQLNSSGNNVVYTNARGAFLPIIADYPVGIWRHVAITGKSGDSRLYVDGAAVIDASNPNPQAFDYVVPTTRLSIGRGYLDRRFFYGAIDEVQIHDRALTEREILAIASAGPAGQCKR